MAIEPIKIPQNVYIEDRIVGPLTLKQIIIVTLGGGFSYALFSSISKAYGVVALPVEILVWIPAVLAVAFAFVRINDLSLLKLCLLTVERMNKPTTRTWSPRRGIIINVRTFTTPNRSTQSPVSVVLDEKKKERIEELSSILDQSAPVRTNEENNDLSPMNEPLEDTTPPQSPATAPRPVNRDRISATPLNGSQVDGVSTTGTVSIFRDISASSHA